jgi:hypothetical protein
VDALLSNRSRAQIAVAWLVVVAVLGILVGVWGTTLGGVVAPHAAAPVATPEPTFGARQTTVTSSGDPTTLMAPPNCLYSQNDQGMPIVMSTKTGSLLTPAQAANCTN